MHNQPPMMLLIGAAVSLAAAGLAWSAQPSGAPPLSVQQVMDTVVDPSADALWEVADTVVTKRGAVDRRPHTPKQWARARALAQRLADGARLLQMPRAVGSNGHWVLADASTPGIRSATQIEADIARDPARFRQAAHRLELTATDAVQAIDRKDIPSLLDAGARIDAACEACHSAYWYPRTPPRPLPAPEAFRPPGAQ